MLTDTELAETTQSIACLPSHATLSQMLNLKLRPGSPWSQMPLCFLLSQMLYKLGRIDDALEAFRTFRRGRPDDNPYYDSLERYLTLRASGLSPSDTERTLKASSPTSSVVREVCEDMADPTKVFSHILLPKCPDCFDCRLDPECLTRCQVDVARSLYPIMKQQMPAQGPYLLESDSPLPI